MLQKTIMSRQSPVSVRTGVDMAQVLKEILEWANRFVPSESGSILLDDPVLRETPRKRGRLYFAACFGRQSAALVGNYISDKKGIAAETYQSGTPYISEDVSSDDKFRKDIDKKISYKSLSIICAPIVLENRVIGVIELINRKNRLNYTRSELILLEIFAGYTANLMENTIAAREFEELSKHDSLTGLYNDRYFLHRLELETGQARAGGGEVSLVFFDLDHFKEINDTHGHLAGSRVLSEIGQILRRVYKDTGAVMARYGGDEYGIILPGTPITVAEKLAEKMRAAIAGHTFLRHEGTKGQPALRIKGLITSSVGVAAFSRDVCDRSDAQIMADQLLRAADDVMYRAKNSGKNRICSTRKPHVTKCKSKSASTGNPRTG